MSLDYPLPESGRTFGLTHYSYSSASAVCRQCGFEESSESQQAESWVSPCQLGWLSISVIPLEAQICNDSAKRANSSAKAVLWEWLALITGHMILHKRVGFECSV